jgi:hypothetical protein
MTGGQTLALGLSIIATLSIFAAFTIFEDRSAQLAVSGLTVIILLLGAQVALPPEAHRMRALRYAVWIFGGVLALIAGLRPYIDELVAAILFQFAPGYLPSVSNESVLPVGLTLLATVVMFVALLLVFREAPPLGHANREPLIREASYRDRLAAFVTVLKSQLERVDDELRWHHRDFVSLRAEVDVRNTDQVRRRVADLVEAIKLNRYADIFVVVGVPGAGKSVALRKCCVDLLAVYRLNEKIPVYVNLKEWLTHSDWSADQPPTDSDFAAFVRANVRDRLSDRGRAFFDEHFDRLVDAGDIFFMFDSFDEIPGLLDADESSKLLDAVSGIIVRYLRGQQHGRGVIASRYYRRPRLGQERHVQLDIRPFGERQIAKVIDRSTNRARHLKKLLFKERPELGALARNPFTLSLILLYWEGHGEAPPSQAALYSAYIDRSLDDAKENLSELNIDQNAMRKIMADISWAMFGSDRRGLEMTVSELREAIGRADMDPIVDALVAARLARRAPRTQAVSFVHRRFNEYFLVARWLSGEHAPPFESIPDDSRYRDALVLYAEVANDVDAVKLAAFCWSEINSVSLGESVNAKNNMRAVHALRFLTEAFRARIAPIVPFRGDLGRRVLTIVRRNPDIVERRLAVEAVGLISTRHAEAVLLRALRSGNRWVADGAFEACRYLSRLPASVNDALLRNIARRDQSWVLVPDKDFSFNVEYSDAFSDLRKRFLAFRIEVWLSVVAGVLCLIAFELDKRLFGIFIFLAGAWCLGSIFIVFLFLWGDIAPKRRRARGSSVLPSALVRFDPGQGIYFSSNPSVEEWLIGVVRLAPLFAVVLVGVKIILPNAEVVNIVGAPGQAGVEQFNWRYVSASMIVASVPFLTWFLWLREKTIKDIFLALMSVKFLIFLGFVFGVGLAFYCMALLVRYSPRWMLVVLLSILVGGVLIAVSREAIGACRRVWRDKARLRSSTMRFNSSRRLIADAFIALETERARVRYVRWLERCVASPAQKAALSDVVGNSWPQNQRPNVGDGEGSILLAQLDARWLGLLP